MRLFLRVIATEALKLRRTLALWMVVAAPFVVVLLQTLIAYNAPAGLNRGERGAWPAIAQNTVALWTVLMMPLFLTLETALLAGLEHTDRNWKAVLALPPPRWMVYGAKLVVAIGLLWIAHAILAAATLTNTVLLPRIQPALHLGEVSWSLLLWPLWRVSIAALCALTIQHWVSLRWQTFTAAMGFGMCVTVAGFVAANSPSWGPWFPWSMSLFSTIRAAATGTNVSHVMTAAVAGAIAMALAGAWEFSRREIS